LEVPVLGEQVSPVCGSLGNGRVTASGPRGVAAINPYGHGVTRSRKLLQIFAVIVVAGGFLLSACAPSESELAKAKQAGADAQIQREAVEKEQAERATLKAQVDKLTKRAAKEKAAKAKAKATSAKSAKKVSKVSKAAKSATSCGGNLSVGSNTTCSFAYNVRAEYLAAGGRNAQFDAYSPVTGQYYVMTCTPGVPTVCRGGNNAVVYIR